jgi:flagellar FliL protein
MLALGGGGFFAVYKGLILGSHPEAASEGGDGHDTPPLPDIAYIAIEPLIVPVGGLSGGRHLRFAAQIEVDRSHSAEVQTILPRFIDVMNTYLRAIDVALLDDPPALVRLRAQLLRRLQLVAGDGRVRDVLITEFVIN